MRGGGLVDEMATRTQSVLNSTAILMPLHCFSFETALLVFHVFHSIIFSLFIKRGTDFPFPIILTLLFTHVVLANCKFSLQCVFVSINFHNKSDSSSHSFHI